MLIAAGVAAASASPPAASIRTDAPVHTLAPLIGAVSRGGAVFALENKVAIDWRAPHVWAVAVLDGTHPGATIGTPTA